MKNATQIVNDTDVYEELFQAYVQPPTGKRS